MVAKFRLAPAFALTLLHDLANVSNPLRALVIPPLTTIPGLKHRVSLMPFEKKSGKEIKGENKAQGGRSTAPDHQGGGKPH